MSATIQYWIVGVILAATVVVAIRSIVRQYRKAQTSSVRCAGCPLADECKTKDKSGHDGDEKTTDLKKCEQIIAEKKKKF